MEDTQVIDWEAEEEEETERSSESVGSNLEPLGRLHIFSSAHGPEKDFPLYLGENVVGRMPDCSVALPFPSISKQHAVIEILAWDKAPILRDCGSLNGTQILRPPKVLSPGVSHRLRDQELILFADLPCQYHRRLDVPLPFASRGPLAIEGTPRAQGGTRTQGLLLAEDSDDEIDPLSESCVVKGSRTTSSPLATVVPESDEEGASSARDGPGAPFGFNLNSDTDEEEGQQPASREASSAARKGAPAESKQPDVDGVAAELQLEKDQPSAKERDSDTKVERGAGNVVVPVRVILERSHPAGEDSDTDVDEERGQPSSFIDSDTDVEEEGIPATPPVVPMKKKQVFRGVGMHGPGVPALAHLQKSQAGGDTGVEQGEANQGSMVINSDTDDEEEVLAPFFLSHLTPKINLHFSPPDSEDLDLQATQCFVERENPSLEVQQSRGWRKKQLRPSCLLCPKKNLALSIAASRPQPFYSRESEASETQHIAAHLEAHGTCPSRPSPPRATPQDQHPESTVHTESLGIQGRGIQTEEKGLDTPRETAESVTPEREPLEREAKELPPEGEREDGLGKEELTRGLQDREQEQVLARDLQRQESDIKMKSANAEWDVKSLKVEMETSKEIQEKEIEKQALAREIFEREAQRPVPEKESEPAELEVKVPKENQKGEASLPTPEPGVGAGALQGLASAPIAPGSQSGRGRVAPVSPTRQRRGNSFPLSPNPPCHHYHPYVENITLALWRELPLFSLPLPLSLASISPQGGQESPDAFLPPSVPEASATFQNLPISQSQKHPILQPLLSPSLPSSATPKLEPLYPKPKVRPRGSSRVTPSPVSSTALEPHPPTPTDQPVSTEPTPWVTQGKTRRSSVKIPEPVEPTAPELQPSTSTDQPVTLNPLSRATRGRTHRSSVRTPEPVEPTAPKLQPSTSTDQPVTLNPLYQPIPAEPIPQPSCNRRQRATRKHESLTAPIVHEPCCTPHEPKSQSSRTQRRGALRAATMDSPPPQKQPQRREVPQKTELPKEEQEGTAERPGKKKNIVIPGPVKRKRDQKEEEPRGTQSRNLRRTKSNQESVAPKVLFTGVVDARGERAVLALGGSLANSVTEASHLVTDRIRRTVKFLCALGRGIPILSLDWLHQSRKAGCFLPPDEYVVTDPEQEKNFGFSLRDALSRAQKRRLLEGYEIHVTPGVQPPPTQMGEIISCCGGTVLPNMPRSYKPQRVVITCSQDFARCSIPCRIGLPLLSPEFLLTGVLKQEANPEAFTLSTSEM
uniref:Mediator of DNA damage checkpoint protein 1 n=1 Tax=Loxodonta africana TaxID=9785 RepID=G3UIU6_LOXAF